MGKDIIDLMDALNIRAPPWRFRLGRRGVCVAAAFGRRVRAVARQWLFGARHAARQSRGSAQEHRSWYQFYFHTERGRAGLAANPRSSAKLLWRLWSPNFKFD